MRSKLLCVAAMVMAITSVSFAQKGHGRGHEPAVESAAVDFGVLPSAPIGPPPCLQSGAIGGPADPCSYKLHHLDPEEVSVTKGGQVTFQVHGGGHGIMIYEVDKGTTREDLGQFLCAGADPETVGDPNAHVCNLSLANANAQHLIADAKGDVVIIASPNPKNENVHPLNRVWYEPGRLMSAGGQQFLNGGTVVPPGTASNGQLVSYRFLKNGRYLVMCMNRVHSLNDWMFGFVNVKGND
jgi:plastocyanin